MAYYNHSNAAYDFARFAPAEEEPYENEEPERAKPKKKAKTASHSTLKPAAVAKMIFIGIFVMISVGCIMVGNIKMTQLSEQISTTQKKLDRAKSEQISLNSKLESRMSLEKVESYATNKLGLVKIQPYQIQYVNLTDKDSVEVSGNSGATPDFIQNIINTVKEYIG